MKKSDFSVIKRAKSATHAIRGILLVLKSTPNMWVHILSALLCIGFGIWLKISSIEWIIVAICIGLVFVAEAFNTSIEIDIDLTSPNFHPYARDTKDVAAGAVLLMGITTWIVGIIIFLPKIYALFQK